MNALHPFTLVLQSAEMITPYVRHLTFTREDKQPLDFLPGQFITLHIAREEKIYRRSYSLASMPGVETTIDIAASYVENGVGTEFLFQLKPGDTVKATGPFGRLVLSEVLAARTILVSTGTGVAPYRTMIPALMQRLSPQHQAVVLLGVRSREELLYAKDFLKACECTPHFEFRAYYSRVLPEDKQSFEYAGHVQKSFDELNLHPSRDVVFLCGNPNMIDDAFEMLKNKGFESHHVRREKYISSSSSK